MNSYQTAPLREYSAANQELAEEIFQNARRCMRSSTAIRYKGSYSFMTRRNAETVAKIVIIESKRGKVNGEWHLPDGVYILTRVSGEEESASSIGIAPFHEKQFKFETASPTDVETACRRILSSLGELPHSSQHRA